MICRLSIIKDGKRRRFVLLECAAEAHIALRRRREQRTKHFGNNKPNLVSTAERAKHGSVTGLRIFGSETNKLSSDLEDGVGEMRPA